MAMSRWELDIILSNLGNAFTHFPAQKLIETMVRCKRAIKDGRLTKMKRETYAASISPIQKRINLIDCGNSTTFDSVSHSLLKEWWDDKIGLSYGMILKLIHMVHYEKEYYENIQVDYMETLKEALRLAETELCVWRYMVSAQGVE